MQYTSGIQNTYFLTYGLSWNFSYQFLNDFIESIHSELRHFVCYGILYTKDVDWRNIKTSVLSKFLYVLHYHYRETYFVCLMLLLMYANAVLLTVKMWACLTLQLRLNYSFRTNNMAFSFRTLIWFFSKKTHSCHQLERPRL